MHKPTDFLGHTSNCYNDFNYIRIRKMIKIMIILMNKDPAEFCVESLRRMVEGHCRFQMF